LTDKKLPRDPETDLALNQDGSLRASSGSGTVQQIAVRKIIPPTDMPDLVAKGIAPALTPNWDRNDPESNWYLGARKLTEERRDIFLTKLEQHGRVKLAARWAGVDYTTILRHRKADPDFDTACREAEDMYHEMCASSILNQARVGQVDERWDKEGNLLSRRVSYEQQLRMMIVKRADPSYNDVSKQEVSVVGGAVIVPAPVDGVETWDDVVRRMSGGGSVNGEPAKALVVDTLGESVGDEHGVDLTGRPGERNEPTDESERPADK
jgi:hypothetical protein